MSYESTEGFVSTGPAGTPDASGDGVYEAPRRRSRFDLILAALAVLLLIGIFAAAYFVLSAAQPGQQPQSMEDAQIQEIQQALKKNPRSTDLYLSLAASYFKLQDYNKASQALSAVRSMDPTGTILAETVYAQAKITEMRGDANGAIAGYERSIAVTDTPDARWALGSLYLQRKQYADAVKNLERYIALMPSDADGYVKLGSAYEAAGDKTKALAAYERAVKFIPNNAAALAAIKRLKGQ